MAPAEADLEVTADDSEVTETTLFLRAMSVWNRVIEPCSPTQLILIGKTRPPSRRVTYLRDPVLMTGSESLRQRVRAG